MVTFARQGLRRLKSTLLTVHLYTGLALCVLFAIWFVSGIAMAYYRNPVLSDAQRLAFASNLWLERSVAPGSVRALADAWSDTDTLRLGMWQGRPIFRWHADGHGWRSAWADTGAAVTFDAETLTPEARRYLGAASIRYDGAFESQSQWSYFSAARDHYPLHQFSTGGIAPRQVLFSSRTGEPIVATTLGSRLMYYLGPGLHYFSFYPIRNSPPLWRGLVNWSSGIGALSCLAGIVLGLWQLRWKAIGTGRNVVPYARRWMRWHHWTGLGFGLFAFTFVLSGLFSMNPGGIFPSTDVPSAMQAAFLGDRPSVDRLPAAEPLPASTTGTPVKEVEWKQQRGQPYLVARATVAEQTLLWPAHGRLEPRKPFTDEELLASVGDLLPSPVRSVERLQQFDDYYYARRDRHRPLPVLRVQLADEQSTWFYLDPADGQLILQSNEGTRLRRWLYNGLHSLDLQALLRLGWWWDAAIWLVSLCGLALSVTSCVVAWQWVARRLPADAGLRERSAPLPPRTDQPPLRP